MAFPNERRNMFAKKPRTYELAMQDLPSGHAALNP
jgi:hypothetical protein